MRASNGQPARAKRIATPQSLNGAVKAICDVMRRSNCAGALQYVPELTSSPFRICVARKIGLTRRFGRG